ncbi:MAG: MBL fold metallo-hydrolase [Phycisphaerae bacterium]|jgi:glyoxylase-like metal-dependent hydrolase (beta-lactamase superfamily II)
MDQTQPSATQRHDLGGCTLTLLNGGRLKLDGGAMFGIIPKPLWTRSTPADERNRIELACNCLLVEWPGPAGRRVIIETGHGPKYAEKEQGFFDVDPAMWLAPTLAAAGVDPATITDVVVSHLHFDHAGGLSRDDDGRLRPTFPNARVHVQRQEYDDAVAGYGIMTATYRRENLTPLDEADRWHLLDGAEEIVPGVRAWPTPGHTRGHQSIVIEGRERSAVFTGDLMPTAAHLGPPYNMGYDLLPVQNRESKRDVLRWAAEREALVVIDHEPAHPVVRVATEKDWFRLEPAT